MKRLYDTSAMINMVLQHPERTDVFVGEVIILDLTLYEAGSTMLKICRRNQKTAEESKSVLVEMVKFMQNMRSLNATGLAQEIFDVSLKRNLSYYNAAYLAVAVKNNLTLVTDDHKLAQAARAELISVIDGQHLGPEYD